MKMRIRTRASHRLGMGESDEGDEVQSEEDWSTGPQSHYKAILALAGVGIAVALLIASLVVVYPYLEENYFGPAPVWHPFSGVFSQSGQLASEGCSVGNLQPILGGVGGINQITPASVVTCSFHGASYVGLYGKDCNLNPNGPIPSINGSQIPFNGCVLSTAPLNSTFSGIFTLGKATNSSLVIYSNHQAIANMTPTDSWKSNHCSLQSDNTTKTNSPLNCDLFGVPYTATDIAQTCNLGTPIQVYGIPIPDGSCNLLRSETITN